jgi:two-component system response regulator YesN
MKAVIIDDEVWSRRIIRNLGQWKSLGIDIVGEAENGFEGWDLIVREQPDIVLLDMRMPGMEGTALIQKLNEQGIGSKVIVISGHADFQYTKHAIDYKASTYILKPIDEDELNKALEKCVREIRMNEVLRQQELQAVHYMNKELSEFIVLHKRELKHLLHGLDGQAITHAFDAMLGDLQQLVNVNDSAIRKMYMEFYLLLEDFLTRSDGNLQDLAAYKAYPESLVMQNQGGAPEELVERLSWLFSTAVDYIADKRKTKEKIDLVEIKRYIDRNCERQVSLETVAEAFYVSKEYLSKAFKFKFKCNLTDYVIGLRMERARNLVSSSDLKIKSIAQSVGYEDVTYFNRLFKNHFAETPGQMRERLTD